MEISPLIWSNRVLMGSSIPRLCCVFLMLVPTLSHGIRSCPHDVEAKANECFTGYSVMSQTMSNDPMKLCCGIDVETLRSFCHSYTHATNCAQQLKRSCPTSKHATIDNILDNLHESKAGVTELCNDDQIYETYAMYQACFEFARRQSENCFTSYLHESATIQFLSKVNTKHKEEFCRNMRNTVSCVQTNVEQSCGDDRAGRVAILLVRPMVRESSDCDYSVLETKSTSVGKSAYISDESRSNHDEGHIKTHIKNNKHHKTSDHKYEHSSSVRDKHGGGGNSDNSGVSHNVAGPSLTRVLYLSILLLLGHALCQSRVFLVCSTQWL